MPYGVDVALVVSNRYVYIQNTDKLKREGNKGCWERDGRSTGGELGARLRSLCVRIGAGTYTYIPFCRKDRFWDHWRKWRLGAVG